MKAGEGTKEAGSIAKDESLLANWIEHVGRLRPDLIKPAHIRSFITKQARADGLIQRLPAEGFKPLKVTTPKRPFFSTNDIERICAAAFEKKKDKEGSVIPVTRNAQQFADYVRLLAYSGVRRNEALALR